MDLKMTADGDLAVEGGRLSLVTGTDEIVQKLRIRLRAFRGEWFLDQTFGVPYFEEVLRKGVTRPALTAIFRDAILETPGVDVVEKLEVSLDAATRKLTVTFAVTTDTGELLSSTIVEEVV